MSKLYYVKCDDFICDVTDRHDHAKQLVIEYQKDGIMDNIGYQQNN